WMVGELTYSSPTSVIAFLPIVVLSAVGVIGTAEMRRLPWDVLILITGGLSLGVAVTETGLAQWLVGRIPLEGLGVAVVALVFAYFTATLSNFMSNTGAANILVPIGFASAAALGVGGAEFVVLVGIALAASAAMCLPIATPPNAIAFSTSQLKSYDFVLVGLLVGLLAPLAAVGWALVVVEWLG
ncbi:MAG: SLC13 family permease, partial [Candidatus Competibacteraceae bacterium]|nr:SLC13 family permease [Candidatus Competibacteraceae bacterium]